MAEYTVLSPQTCILSPRAKIGRGAVIWPNNVLLGDCMIGEGAVLYPGNLIEDSSVGAGAVLTASVIKGSQVGAGAQIGPFAHLRPGSQVGGKLPCRQLCRGQGLPPRPRRAGGPSRLHRRCRRGRKHQHRLRRCLLQLRRHAEAPRAGGGSLLHRQQRQPRRPRAFGRRLLYRRGDDPLNRYTYARSFAVARARAAVRPDERGLYRPARESAPGRYGCGGGACGPSGGRLRLRGALPPGRLRVRRGRESPGRGAAPFRPRGRRGGRCAWLNCSVQTGSARGGQRADGAHRLCAGQRALPAAPRAARGRGAGYAHFFRHARAGSPRRASLRAAGMFRRAAFCPRRRSPFSCGREGADFGAVISASHNPPEYNGLKVFDRSGQKLQKSRRRASSAGLTNMILRPLSPAETAALLPERGTYADFLVAAASRPLAGKTFVLDCAYGAASSFAPRVFRRLGARVLPLCCGKDGRASMSAAARCIRQGCAAPCERAAPMPAFALTATPTASSPPTRRGKSWTATRSSASRPRAARTGQIASAGSRGVRRTQIRASSAPSRGRGSACCAADIGDKYVAAEMRRCGAAVGGEQSGHVILAEYAATGDGILTAVKLAELLCGEKLSALRVRCRLLPQVNRSVACTIKCACWAASGCMPPSRAKAPMSSGWSCALRERNRSCAVFAEGRLPAGAALRAAERVVSEILAGEA